MHHKMLYLFLLISSAIADQCSHVFDDTKYAKSTMLTTKGLPTNLVYNPLNKELLFTLIDLETLQNDEIQTKMDQYILRNGQPIIIDNVNGQAAAVDERNNKVYVASDNGLHILNETDRANFVGMKDEDIVQLFKPKNSDDLYAVFFPDNEVYKIDANTEKHRIENVPCAYIIAVDSDENIFYECDSKYIKVLLKDFQESIEFVGFQKNSARAIAVDENDRVILAANDGLYWLKHDNVIPKKLMNLDFVPAGVAFNGDSIFVSSTGVIYEYKMCR